MSEATFKSRAKVTKGLVEADALLLDAAKITDHFPERELHHRICLARLAVSDALDAIKEPIH